MYRQHANPVMLGQLHERMLGTGLIVIRRLQRANSLRQRQLQTVHFQPVQVPAQGHQAGAEFSVAATKCLGD